MQNRTTPERPKLPAQCLTLPCTGNYIGPHVLTPRGLVQQYTASSQKLVADHPEIAFPDGDNVATFIGCFTRSNANKNNPMIDETSSRQAVLFLFQFDPETDNSQANRRLLGESAATQLTSHANTTLMTGFSYKYSCTFEYKGDDPAYGPAYTPLTHHLFNTDAVKVYLNQFVGLGLTDLAKDDLALADIFGEASDETRALATRGGNEEIVPFNPG
jgi:hypothetical protein